jgi:hypothetical protein
MVFRTSTAPRGLVEGGINLIAYKSQGSARSETGKAAQLQKIRRHASAAPTPAQIDSADSYRKLMSPETIARHREAMRSLRSRIATTNEQLRRLDAPPPRHSALKRFVAGMKRAADAIFLGAVLSRPSTRGDIAAAMQRPVGGKGWKGSGKADPSIVLDQARRKERKCKPLLRQAELLERQAQEQHNAGPAALRTYRQSLHRCQQELTAAESDARKLSSDLSIVQDALDTAGHDLDTRVRDAENELIWLKATGSEEASITRARSALREARGKLERRDQAHALHPQHLSIKEKRNLLRGELETALQRLHAARRDAADLVGSDGAGDGLGDDVAALQREIDDISTLLASPQITQDLAEAKAILDSAQALHHDARAGIADARKAGADSRKTGVEETIVSLSRFAPEPYIEENDSDTLTNGLQDRFGALYERLCETAPADNELDNETVFALVHDALADTLAPLPGAPADPQRAAKVLCTWMEQPAPAQGDKQPPHRLMDERMSQDALRVAQRLAVVPRGMEALQRAIAGGAVEGTSPAHIQARTRALQIHLRAGKELAERGQSINASTQELLLSAQNAAAKQYADPDAALDTGELAALAAIRNRLTDTSPQSNMQYVADRLSKATGKWVPNGIERGRLSGTRHVLATMRRNLAPMKDKAPINRNTIALAESTTHAYGWITAKRFDKYVRQSGAALREAVAARMATPGAAKRADKYQDKHEESQTLLLWAAAYDTAIAKMTAAGTGMRPEHAVLGLPSETSLTEAINEHVKHAFAQAGLATHEEQAEAISGTIANAVVSTARAGCRHGEGLRSIAAQYASAAIKAAPLTAEQKTSLRQTLNGADAVQQAFRTQPQDDLDAVRTRFAELAAKAGLDAANTLDTLDYSLPPMAATPLLAETLSMCGQLLQRHPDPAAKGALDRAAKEVGRLEDLMTPEGDIVVNDPEDAFSYLTKKLEQFELLGKLRFSSGGSAGGNLKPVTAVVNAALWVAGGFGLFSLSPKLRIEGTRTRNAVFELAMSPVGIEIFIGSERKISGALGGGLGASFGIREGNAGLAGEKAASGEHVRREGVKFMIPRSPTGAYTDDDARLEAKDLLDAIFHGMPSGGHAGDIHGMPANLAAILARCPNVSVAVIDDMSDRAVKQESAGSAAFSSKGTPVKGSKQAAGLIAGGGRRNTRLTDRLFNASEKSGYHNAEYRIVSYGGQTARQKSAGGSVTAGAVGSNVKGAFALGAGGWYSSKQSGVAGANMKLRLISVDGKTHPPITWRDTEFNDVETFAQRIAERREDWLQLAMEQMFKGEDAVRIPVAEQRRRASASLDKAIADCRKLGRTREGNDILRNVWLECYCMTDAAAAVHDGIRARQALAEARTEELERHVADLKQERGNRLLAGIRKNAALVAAEDRLRKAKAETTALIDAQNALLVDQATWKPWKLAAVERTQEMSQTGIDLFVKTGAADAAEGQVMHLLWP